MVLVTARLLNTTVPGPEYNRHWIAGGGLVKVTAPCSWKGKPVKAVASGPALAAGAPGERGPSAGPVVWTTSKFVTPMLPLNRWLRLVPQRSSGVIEIEKNELLL